MDAVDAWLLEYVEKKQFVFGWDWDADLAYAKAANADPETIRLIASGVGGDGPAVYLAYTLPAWKGVTRARTKALARLTRAGHLTASWAGIPSSVTGGATRTREWKLSSPTSR